MKSVDIILWHAGSDKSYLYNKFITPLLNTVSAGVNVTINSIEPLRRKATLIALLLLSSMAYPVKASEFSQITEPIHAGWTITFENDIFVGEDSRYTNGIAFYYGKGTFKRFTRSNTPHLIHGLIKNTYINRNESRKKAIVFGLFQAMQTPENITSTELQLNDVPYAGLLAAETQLFAVSDSMVDRVTLTIGVVGPLALAKEAQKVVHKIVGADDPRGWHHQIKNELVGAVELQRSIRLIHSPESQALEADLVSLGSVAVGNLRSYVSGAIFVRIGNNLVDSFPLVSSSPNRQINPTAFSTRRSWDVFAGLRSAYIGNEIVRSGNTFSNSHSADLDHTQLQFSAGVGWNLNDWAFNLVVTEFVSDKLGDPYGSFSITRRTQ